MLFLFNSKTATNQEELAFLFFNLSYVIYFTFTKQFIASLFKTLHFSLFIFLLYEKLEVVLFFTQTQTNIF